jgi:hypothetical protein
MLPLYAIMAWEKEKSSYIFRLRKLNTLNHGKNFVDTCCCYVQTQINFDSNMTVAIFIANMSYATTVCRTESVAMCSRLFSGAEDNV